MRIVTAAALAGLAIVGLSGCNKNNAAAPSGQASASNGLGLPSSAPPHRKPGLWEQTMTSDQAAGVVMPVTQLCVDENTEKNAAVLGARVNKACQANMQIKHNFDGTWSTSSSCDMPQVGRIATTATITGDFNSSYSVNIDSTISGAPTPAMNGEHKMAIQAHWVGPCPAGWVGGDTSVGGVKMNVLAGAAGPSAATN